VLYDWAKKKPIRTKVDEMNKALYLVSACGFLIQTRPSWSNGTINVEPLTKFNASGVSKKDAAKEKSKSWRRRNWHT